VDISLIKKLIEDLYFDYDRLSESGQYTLDKIDMELNRLKK